MSQKLIFLSHIHEEKELALLIKNAIEDEFSGFVDVFVSSDGESIPAGTNFLKRIEMGLTNCIGAIYLISPISVKRNWINFELGAIWIRSCVSEQNGGNEIPTLPFCHSGMTYGLLPQPICNLNAVQASNASQIEFAFKSIQKAVGAKGKLKTDFDELAKNIAKFEEIYTVGDKIKAFAKLFLPMFNLSNVKVTINNNYLINLGLISNEQLRQGNALIPMQLKNDMKLHMEGAGIWSCDNGESIHGGPTDLILSGHALNKFREVLNNK